jgi:hypothetical protein
VRLALTLVQRTAVTAAVSVAVLGPVAGFLAHPRVPIAIRLGWFVAVIAATLAPVPSFLAFLAVGAALPVVPSLLGWPHVSLLEQWALALLVPAALRAAWRADDTTGDPSRLASLLAAIATVSAVVAIAPLVIANGGAMALATKTAAFLRTEYVVGSSQRHVLASVASWAVLVEGLAMFWLARRVVAQIGRVPVLATLGGASVVVAAVGLWQWWTGEHLLTFWRVYDPFLRRINATFTDVNALGAFLAMMLPAVAWLAATASTATRRGAWTGGAALLMVANVFTASRAAWVAMLMGVLVLGGLVWFNRVVPSTAAARQRAARLAVVAGALAAVAFAGLVAWGTISNARVTTTRTYFDPVLATLNLRAPLAERLKGRLAFWEAGAAMVTARPLTGIGIGRFYKDVSRYVDDSAALPLQQENAHNYFLQVAAEMGVPAVLALLGIWIGALRRARRDVADVTREPGDRWAAAAAAGGVVAFALTCVSGHSMLLLEGQVFTWTVVAVALGPRGAAATGSSLRGALAAVAALAVAVTVVPRARAAIDAVDLTRSFSGMHDDEVWADGRHYRWTEGEAVFHVPASAVSVTFTLRGLAPVAQRVEVSIDGRAVDQLLLDDHNWRVVRYVLPAGRGPRYRPITLRVTPTWQAPGDVRTLGVMLSGIEWTMPAASD